MKFVDAILKQRIYFDGAMGSSLIERGYSTEYAEELNLTHPEVITEIHKGFVNAGSNAVFTNTFGANSLKLGKRFALDEIINAAISHAKASNAEYVGYDCGPLGKLLYPYGELSFEEAYSLFAEQAKIVANKDIDFVVIETIADTLELKAAILAFKENCDLPVLCSMTFDKGGRTYVGCSVGAYAQMVQGLGVTAMGLNCGAGPDIMLENIKELIKYAHIPVFAKPNAGIPVFCEGKTVYDMDYDTFAGHMLEIAKTGVNILGGCCGTSDKYIKRLVELTSDTPMQIFDNNIDAVSSGRRVVRLNSPVIVGERLNPTGKPLLKKAIIEDDYDYILKIATEQIEEGADILDVNMGMAGIDEREKLSNAIVRLQSVVDAPLQIDSARQEAVSAAMRVVDGIPIINSVNGEESSMNSILPLAKKYGAYVIALCLDERGIPDLKGRLEIAERILTRAKSYGIESNKLIFDPLTLAISVDINNALITLEGIKELTEKGYKTALGLSNVSFGLPYREAINATFYDMALKAGLKLAIINPSMKMGIDAYAENALIGKDEDCRLYIERYSGYQQQTLLTSDLTVEECIKRGLKKEGVEAVKKITNKDNYLYIISNYIIKGLNSIGELYEQGKMFLPQLIAGAESAKGMLAYIESQYMEGKKEARAGVILATVKGDVHDIGKNIVKAILANYGYRIYDLGKNVDTATLLEAIEAYKPQIVGLSALMTTTLDNMAESVAAIRQQYPNIVTIVGGAVVTCDYADSIGAKYAKDAQECARLLNEIF